MSRKYKTRIVDLEAALAGEKAKGVLLEKRAERAEALLPGPAKKKLAEG